MSEAILDAFRHNAWATRVLIEFCRGLDEEQLTTGAPGVYGSVIDTLKHLVTSEGNYTSLFTGTLPDWDTTDYEKASLGQVAAWATDSGSIWEAVLSRSIDGDALLKRRQADGSDEEVRAGVMLAQVLHHSNAHREQVSAVLTGLGLTPPNVSAWAYGRETGRYRLA